MHLPDNEHDHQRIPTRRDAQARLIGSLALLVGGSAFIAAILFIFKLLGS